MPINNRIPPNDRTLSRYDIWIKKLFKDYGYSELESMGYIKSLIGKPIPNTEDEAELIIDELNNDNGGE